MFWTTVARNGSNERSCIIHALIVTYQSQKLEACNGKKSCPDVFDMQCDQSVACSSSVSPQSTLGRQIRETSNRGDPTAVRDLLKSAKQEDLEDRDKVYCACFRIQISTFLCKCKQECWAVNTFVDIEQVRTIR
jgi:hypothetical protein